MVSVYDTAWRAFRAQETEAISLPSLFSVGALLSSASGGHTKEQLETAYRMDSDTLNRFASQYIAHTGMWVKMGANLSPADTFLTDSVSYLDADIFATVFDYSAVKAVNNWAGKCAKDKDIQFLDNIDSYSRIYMAGISTLSLEIPNLTGVTEQPFYLDGVNPVPVSMLQLSTDKFVEGLHVKGFMVDLEEPGVTLVCLLPDEDIDMPFFLNTFNGPDLYELVQNPKCLTTDAFLPALQLSTQYSLDPVLQYLGVAVAYSKTDADFSGMGSADEPLFLSSAAAYTALTLDASRDAIVSAPLIEATQTLRMDRPFLLAVIDTDTRAPIYLGVVQTPK